MDNDKVVELLLDVRDRMGRVETKLDSYKEDARGLCERVDKVEQRVTLLEKAPGSRWNQLTGAIISAIGTIIGGGIIAAVAMNIKP